MKVAIVYVGSGSLTGRGLSKDSQILSEIICKRGHHVEIVCLQPQSQAITARLRRLSKLRSLISTYLSAQWTDSCHRWLRKALTLKKLDASLIIHLENIHPSCLDTEAVNWLIPNQEWFRTERLHYLGKVDAILCKTLEAQAKFRPYHKQPEHLSFSNPAVDLLSKIPLAKKNREMILHVAGASAMKGTMTVLKVWKRHPEWPELTIVANQLSSDDPLPSNVKLRSNLSPSDMVELWHKGSIAVLPSEAEGFGQVIIEAMAAGALVITTDAPPMNELVNQDRGYLVRYKSSNRKEMGERYWVNADELESTINQALYASTEENRKKISAARDWTIENEKAFRGKLEAKLIDVETLLSR